MERLGGYRLIKRLGAGGMGEVWRAEDVRLLRPVAIKILPASLATDPEWKERFLREARTIAQLNHPNIATIYNIDEDGPTLFIAMELVEGESLAAMIERGPMNAADAVRVASHVANALSEAHSKDIVHRDVKPDNILVSQRLVKVLDFGIAKQIGGTADPSLTQGGMVVGTPHYMSPEQALGRSVDARTDIFSLGVVLYEMLSGTKPFTGEAVTEILLHIVMNEPADIALVAPGITEKLANVVRRSMNKQPDGRYATAEQLRMALMESLRELRAMPAETSSAPTPKPSPGLRPAAPPPPRARTGPLPPTTASRAAGEGPRRALVADDDPATRYLLTSVLQRHNIAYDEAENGVEAVKYLKTNDYSLVFIDLLMPRVDGWGVVDFIRRAGKTPRLFIVTGVQDQKLSAADQDVVSGLLYKPIDIRQIERVVQAT